MAGEVEPKRTDRRIANVVWKAGLVVTGIGVLGPESLVAPGLVAAGAGYGYEKATEPKQGTKMESGGNIIPMRRGNEGVLKRAARMYGLKSENKAA